MKVTDPHERVRAIVADLGYPCRAAVQRLPGRPEFVFEHRRKVIFLRDCLWHRHLHPDCHVSSTGHLRPEIMVAKLQKNRQLDLRHAMALRRAGWDIWAVWDCQSQDKIQLTRRLRYFLRRGTARALAAPAAPS